MIPATTERLTLGGSHSVHFTPHRLEPFEVLRQMTDILAAGKDRLISRSASSNHDGICANGQSCGQSCHRIALTACTGSGCLGGPLRAFFACSLPFDVLRGCSVTDSNALARVRGRGSLVCFFRTEDGTGPGGISESEETYIYSGFSPDPAGEPARFDLEDEPAVEVDAAPASGDRGRRMCKGYLEGTLTIILRPPKPSRFPRGLSLFFSPCIPSRTLPIGRGRWAIVHVIVRCFVVARYVRRVAFASGLGGNCRGS